MNPKIKKTKPRVQMSTKTHVKTKMGWLERIGTTQWGKALVKCPQCGEPATAGKSGNVWCRACGYDTETLVGCT